MERFDRTAGAKIMKRKHRGKVDRHFIWVLRQFSTIHEFVRTDAEDRVVNEVIRGAIPKRVRKPIDPDKWYGFLKKRKDPRESIWFDKENGRYYLVWSRPVEIGKEKRYGGSVAVLIDLWNSFHRFSKRIKEPFLIIINGKILYSHEWKLDKASIIESFEVPGVKKAAIRFRRAPVVAAEPEVPAAAVVEPAAEEPAETAGEAADEVTEEDTEEPEGSCGKGLLVFLIIMAFVIVVGRLLYRKYQKKLNEILRNIRNQSITDRPVIDVVKEEQEDMKQIEIVEVQPPAEIKEPPAEAPPGRIDEPPANGPPQKNEREDFLKDMVTPETEKDLQELAKASHADEPPPEAETEAPGDIAEKSTAEAPPPDDESGDGFSDTTRQAKKIIPADTVEEQPAEDLPAEKTAKGKTRKKAIKKRMNRKKKK
jgi:hypothetical protein